jgi:ABC-type bacteriocin/lantibiotic exporter with double-glycine peptidase domain
MSKNLAIPHYPQLADGYCLPACVQMILAYQGIQRDQIDIAQQLKTNPQAGTPGPRLRLLASSDLKVTYEEGIITDLELALKRGIPPIALVFTGELPYWNRSFAHAVVVLSIEDDVVLLHDPGLAQGNSLVSLGDFHLAWDEMGNLFGLIEVE